eukprot:2708339-Karenia_brevis.AAC.1
MLRPSCTEDAGTGARTPDVARLPLSRGAIPRITSVVDGTVAVQKLSDSCSLNIEAMDNSENGNSPGTNTMSRTPDLPMDTPDQHFGSSAGSERGY